jgi:hypothetical protein
MRTPKNAPSLALLISSLLMEQALAQQNEEQQECIDLTKAPPGLYVTVDQSQVYLIKDDKIVELDPGESAYANETELACLKVRPDILAWPCGTAEDLSRLKAQPFTVEDLPSVGVVGEVARRYFEDNEALDPPIEWLNGEIHTTLPAEEFAVPDSSAYWYLPGEDGPLASSKRPKTQLIGLFWSTKQLIIDGSTLEELKAQYSGSEIPTVFVYFEDNEVPISFFGSDVTLKEIFDAYLERGIEVAPPPVWYAGDHTLKVDISEFEEYFDIPPLEEIDEDRVAAIKASLETYGFSTKPVTVSMMGQSGTMIIDQAEKVRVAASMGISAIPTVVFHFSPVAHLSGCGVVMPQLSVVGNAKTKEELTPPVPPPPPPPPPELPPPERPASES